MIESLDLKKVLDMDKWIKLQESIAAVTHLAFILVDYRGKPLTPHSRVKPFCKLARSHCDLAYYCEKCDARGGVEAARSGKPFIYRCHFDIIDIAIPILIDNQYVGAIMAGEILAESNQSALEQVLKLDNDKKVINFKNEHKNLINQYPRASLSELDNISIMIEQLTEYIISEAIKKDYLIKTYKQTLRIGKHEMLNEADNINLESIQKDLHETLLENRLGDNGIYQAKNRSIQPAIDAIFTNKNTRLDLTYLAEIVNLSPTYLSRLLKDEFGEPFSRYYSKLKTQWAKELLKNSELLITEISDALGYVEPSYFVRNFKKNTGISPLKWRQLQNNKST